MSSLSAGSKFGKYRVVRLLGRGGMGSVYLAEDQMLGREIALKVLNQAVTLEVDFESRFRREAQLVAGLKHPRIIPVHSLERIDDTMVLDMPYVEGGSLAQAESRGRLRFQQAAALVRDVLEALACCHDAGIVHRDVKPSNILIGDDGRGLLTDFGLAKLLAAYHEEAMQTTSSSGFFVGTPRYAPPESWDGEAPTPAWDVYSAGAVLYEAATGETPYPAETPYLLVKQMVERPAKPLREVATEVSAELADLVDSMLEQDPAKRPQDAGEALGRLMNVPELGGLEGGHGSTVVRVAAPKMSISQRRARQRRTRHFLRRAIVGVGVLVAFAGGLVWGIRNDGPVSTADSAVASMPATPYRIYDTFEPDSRTRWPNHWLMEPSEGPGTWDVVAFESTHLWFMQASESDGVLALEGSWAEYADETARVFRHGTLTGTARTLSNGLDMMVTLDFWCELDGMEWSESFVLTPSKAPETKAEFLRGLEANSHLQGLLYQELAPRDVAWLEAFEERFLGPMSGRTVVPFLHTGMGAVVVDGRLDEAAWHVAFSAQETALGRLPGRSAAGASEMLLRYTDEGLYLGLHVEGATADAATRLTLLDRFAIPLADASRWSVQVGAEGLVAARLVKRGQPAEWACTWEAACSSAEAFEAEVFIPFDSLDSVGPTDVGRRWRMNCVVEGSGGTAVARWGFGQTEQAEHGALLVFGFRE